MPSQNAQSPAFFHAIPSQSSQVAGAEGLPIQAELAENRKKDTRFQARFFRTPWGGDLRTVHIKGPKVEIINLFHFPFPEQALPVYAIEFVVFGKRPIVGVIDLKMLVDFEDLAEQSTEIMLAAHQRFPQLKPADDPPDWYEECRSGDDFFTRPESLDLLDDLIACHDYVWERLCTLANARKRLPEAWVEAQRSAVQDYKDHHRINSPGLPFLNRQFGEEWTDRFLREGLFA